MGERPYFRRAVPHSGSHFPTHRALPTAPKTIGAQVCNAVGCGQIVVPEVDYSTGFRREVWPEKCHRCGTAFAPATEGER